jgi:hypothetical protein
MGSKAAYCKFVASITDDDRLRQYYKILAAEWQREAKQEKQS